MCCKGSWLLGLGFKGLGLWVYGVGLFVKVHRLRFRFQGLTPRMQGRNSNDDKNCDDDNAWELNAVHSNSASTYACKRIAVPCRANDSESHIRAST